MVPHQLFPLHFCGYCEEACPTYAIQLTTDFEMSEYDRRNLVYEKEDLMISRTGQIRITTFTGLGRPDRRERQGGGGTGSSRLSMCGV